MTLEIKCFLLLLLYLFLYLSLGSLFLRLLKEKTFSFLYAIIVGFLTYYALFQITALPMMLTLRPLSLLSGIWMKALVVFAILGVVFCSKTWFLRCKEILTKETRMILFYGAVFLLIAFQVWYVSTHYLVNMDSAFYIGTANTAVYTDTMYQYSPYTGMKRDSLELRYALSSFTMDSAVFCQTFRLPALVFMRVVFGSLDVILSNLVILLLGRKFFGKDALAVLFLLFLSVLVTFYNYSEYTSSWFLLARSYEGKAFCGNVILPSIFLLCFSLMEEHKSKKAWILLFLGTFSCNAISMSSMLTVPIMVSALLIPFAIRKKSIGVFMKYALCMIPCLAVLIAYYLYTKNIFVIPIR